MTKFFFYNSHKTIGFAFFFVIAVLFFSCAKDEEFNMGDNFVESQGTLKILDTFRVDLSTVLLDSVLTSSTGTALVGRYSDKQFGTISSTSYFKVAFPSVNDITSDAVFDSAVVMLNYNNYSFGDTTKKMSISVHTLSEDIDKKGNAYLYNSSSFTYSSAPIGTTVFYPNPNGEDSVIYIRVDDYGKELLDLYKEGNEIVYVSEYFLDYVKGFAIKCNYGNSILGFTADASNLYLKIFYHYEKEDKEVQEILISMSDESFQFNNIQHDFTGTLLEKFSDTNRELKSSETDNKAFLQVLVGLMPKIQFPTLKDLFLNDKWKVLKAELVMEPVKNSYNLFKLPTSLYLYDTDKHNTLGDILEDTEGNMILPVFNEDLVYNEETTYTFDITSFINTELSDSYFDYYHGFLIGLQGSTNTSSFNRILIENNSPKVKLRLYYLSY
jgi:hypothetical protein